MDGDGEIRTLDPLLARQVLSQLSYAPIPDGSLVWLFRKSLFQVLFQVFSPPVGLSGLEPPTSRLSGVRSNQLSYKPLAFYSVTGNGDGEIRTLDPLLARQVLSQLSYAPI